MNPVAHPPQSKRLLGQMREVLRYKHYSLKTEQAYLYWVRFFIRWCGRSGQIRHPRDMGAAKVTQFLTMLANERRVSVSSHNQALSALLFCIAMCWRSTCPGWRRCSGQPVPIAFLRC
ncbi:MAG: phage integrase N-terminal SAM-like domain-containing protein [Burkholderiaceae bacterium]|nr:phage integrase N-terminal SAM-like domain-containing protein [Burkholderiaceae bacterium]